MRLRPALLALLALPLAAPRLPAQANVPLPADSIERLMAREPFDLRFRQDTRFQGDRTQRVLLAFGEGRPDSVSLGAKWARSAPNGQAFNNEPRYEVAAYVLQKLFLDEPDYVVPPTVARAVPLDLYRRYEPEVGATFSNTRSVLVVLQYWLSNVTQREVYDRGRIAADTAYARCFGNLNLLTYLIRQADSNNGNVLISRDSLQPRMFSVDNGVAFRSVESDRGTLWKDLRTDRLPRASVERLRKLRREDLERALAVVAEFRLVDGALVPVPPGAALDSNRGVRHRGDVYQLGLTGAEITDVETRLRALLKRVDSGKLALF